MKLIIAVLTLALLVSVFGCGKKEAKAPEPESMATSSSGLKWTDIEVGSGAEAVPGKTVSIEYTGKLDDGTVFDATSRHNNEPLEFTLGAGDVVKGMDEGVMGMKVGGVRDIVIPPELGYGDDDMGPIPPNSTIHFRVKLVEVK